MSDNINIIGQMPGFECENRVYSPEGVCPSIKIGGDPKKIIEISIVAMRGRDPQNPSDRTSGNPNLEQRLEPNSEGICNTLTTVQKDNMVLEVGHIEKGTGKHQSNVVYSEEGLAPTICASYGVKQPPAMHCEINVLGNYMPSNYDASRVVDTNGLAPTVKENHGTVTGIVEVRQATKEGSILCEVGGGGRSELSKQYNTQRKGTRERTDMPNTNDGEYP